LLGDGLVLAEKSVTRVLAVLATLLLATGPSLAHGGHDGHAGATGGTDPLVPAALVGGGVLVLGTATYLAHRGRLDDRLADLGVLLGIVGLLAGAALALV